MNTLKDNFHVDEIRARIHDSAGVRSVTGGHELTFAALGTQCRVVFVAPAGQARQVAERVVDWVAQFEAKYSRFWPHSLVSRINAAAGRDWVDLDPEAESLLALNDQLVFLSRGLLDPTSLPLIRLWDWKTGKVPDEADVAAARLLVGWSRVQRRPGGVRLPAPGMALDFGGMGKEYAVDQVIALLTGAGVASALVDFGADVRAMGLPPDGRPAWLIGLEDPVRPGNAWTGISVRNCAVASSGDYVRKFEIDGRRYGHIIDPRSGRPVANGVRSVHVIAPSCTQAGLLSTSAFVAGPVEGLRLLNVTMGVSGAIVTDREKMFSQRFHENLNA